MNPLYLLGLFALLAASAKPKRRTAPAVAPDQIAPEDYVMKDAVKMEPTAVEEAPRTSRREAPLSPSSTTLRTQRSQDEHLSFPGGSQEREEAGTVSFLKAVPAEQRRLLRDWFGWSVDCSKIRMRRVGKHMARTMGNTIYFPEGWKMEDLDSQVYLAHEIGHVWQYQNFGVGYIPRAAGEQIFNWLKDRNRSLYKFTLLPARPLRKYPVEKQAEIIACAYAYQQLKAPLYMEDSCTDWSKIPTAQRGDLLNGIRQSLFVKGDEK